MARPRKGSKNKNTNQQEESKTMAVDIFTELSEEDLADVLAGSRTRGVYDEGLVSFVESGARGSEVNLTEGQFAGKKAQSIKTGFEGAKRRLAEGKVQGASDELKEAGNAVKVIMKGDRVFLLRQAV